MKTVVSAWGPPASLGVLPIDTLARAAVPLERRYETLFEVASGGMGTVYVGRRLGADGFQRLVAIKRMHASIAEDPECAAAFRDEARIASLVQHANVVAIHDVHEDVDGQFLVMEYIDGASLATLMNALRGRRKRLATRVALRIVIDALRGLHAAHELVDHDGRALELVHRDATPHNILIGVDGCVRLTDFGIARAAARTVHTEPGFAKGKYTYMAPEQAFADPVDRRADVFTMGVVLWEALTGQRLFAGRSVREVQKLVAIGDIPAPSKAGADARPELDQMVLRALAPWREDRYSTATEFADALHAYATSVGGLAPPSAVAEVLDIACGDVIRERRARVRRALAAPRQDDGASRAPESSRVARIDTPSPASVDVHFDSEPPRSSAIRRAAWPLATAAFALALGVTATLGGVALATREAPVARRVAYEVIARFGAARAAAGARLEGCDAAHAAR